MMSNTPRWYGSVEPPLQCTSCGHAMFDSESDGQARVEFCPKCGRQDVGPRAAQRATSGPASSFAKVHPGAGNGTVAG